MSLLLLLSGAGAGGFPVPSFTSGAKLIIVGDSIAQQNHFATSTKVSSRNNGWVEWALARLPSFQNVIWYDATADGGAASPLFRGANYGQSGDTAPQVASRTAQMIESGADIAVVLCGTNTGSDASVSVATDAIQSVIDDLTGAGIYVVLSTIWPREVEAAVSGSTISPALWERIESINTWIRTKNSAMVRVIDPVSALKDPSPVSPLLDGSPIPGLYYDEVHPAAKGAKVAGDVLYDFLSQTIDSNIYSSAWFESDPTGAGNRLLDGDLDGTSGTARYGMTGDVATNWVAECLNGGTNVTGVASVGSSPYHSGQYQQMVLTSDGLGSASGQEKCQFLPLGFRVDEGSMTNGQYQSLKFLVEIDNPDGVLGSIYSENRNTTTGEFGYGMEFRNATNADEPMPTGSYFLWLESQPIVYNTSNTFSPALVFPILEGISGSCTIKVHDALLIGVENPQTTFPYTFTPAYATNLAGWYNATDASTITHDAGSVSAWNDKSGLGRHLTQDTPARQPATGLRTQNSLNVIDFNGDTIQSAAFTEEAQVNTVYIAGVFDVTTTQYMLDSLGASSRNAMLLHSSNYNMLSGGSFAAGAAADTSFHIFKMVFDGSSSVLGVDGVDTTGLNPGTNGTDGVILGSDRSPGFFLNGAIGEVVRVNGAVTAGDETNILAYLQRWIP